MLPSYRIDTLGHIQQHKMTSFYHYRHNNAKSVTLPHTYSVTLIILVSCKVSGECLGPLRRQNVDTTCSSAPYSYTPDYPLLVY